MNVITRNDDGTWRETPWNEWVARLDAERRERFANGWGPPEARWVFDPERRTLTTTAGGYPYELDVETFTTSAAVLDWIFQLHGKAWCSPELLHALAAAIYDLVNPQRNLCSWGIECGPIVPREIIKLPAQVKPTEMSA